MNTDNKQDINIEISKIIHSDRKSYRIEIKNNKLVIIAPLWAKKDDIDKLLKSHHKWIINKLEYYQKYPDITKEFVSGEQYLFLGEEYPLAIEENPPYAMRFHDKTFFLAADCAQNGTEYFTQFYKQKAKKIITQRTEEIAKILDIKIQTVKITSARRRWGSCTSRGNLNFSFRLIMAPPKTIDGVIVHELAHRFEMNHSSKFYAVVEKILPDYKTHDAWLKKNNYKMLWI